MLCLCINIVCTAVCTVLGDLRLVQCLIVCSVKCSIAMQFDTTLHFNVVVCSCVQQCAVVCNGSVQRVGADIEVRKLKQHQSAGPSTNNFQSIENKFLTFSTISYKFQHFSHIFGPFQQMWNNRSPQLDHDYQIFRVRGLFAQNICHKDIYKGVSTDDIRDFMRKKL